MDTPSIEARLLRLEDVNAIAALKAAYCAACDDDHDGEAVAGLFSEDGVWQRAGEDPNEGRAAIAAYMDRIRQSGRIARSAHMVTNPVIEVDGDRATGRWRFVMLWTQAGDDVFHRIIGHYRDAFVRREGRWWFERLEPNVEEQGRYEAVPTDPTSRGVPVR